VAAAETIVLFHSVYGPRPAVHAAADRLRAAGHRVLVPDLYDGRTADDREAALRLREEIGAQEVMRRAVAFVAPHLGERLVYAGMSMGASIAQELALVDAHARGLLLLHGTGDVDEDVSTDLAVQLHVADPDPSEPDDWLNTWYLRMTRAGADVEVYRYRGAGHLYTDQDLPDHDEEAADHTWSTALGFLAGL
jgi:dienelactone hydrolase